jgi:hypothetical protein
MTVDSLRSISTLTFDVFGTVLDLTGSLVPPIQKFMEDLDAEISGEKFGHNGGRDSVSSSIRTR